MNIINIITYNVLSSNLADLMQNEKKDNKLVYPIEIISNDIRWHKISNFISNKLNKQIPNLIICLQEVSEDWLILFASLFTKFNYKYINVQYGRAFNGNMGIMIAYPSDLIIVKSNFFNIGSHVLVIDEISARAASKSNIAILVIFEKESINLKFGIITYHMPCEPLIPKIGLTHSKILYKKIIRFMKNTVWLFVGDFNMLPNTKTYRYLSSKANCIWKDYLDLYPITNYSYIKGYEFSGCLDYIFYTKIKLKCINIQISKINNIIPDINNPSDHIPIVASFKLIN